LKISLLFNSNSNYERFSYTWKAKTYINTYTMLCWNLFEFILSIFGYFIVFSVFTIQKSLLKGYHMRRKKTKSALLLVLELEEVLMVQLMIFLIKMNLILK